MAHYADRDSRSIDGKRRWQQLRLTLLLRRRLLAALLVSLAVFCLGKAMQPKTTPTISLVTAAANLPAGHLIRDADVAIRQWPRQFAAPTSFDSIQQTIGRMTSGEISEGEPLGPTRVIGPSILNPSPETVAVSVRISDPSEVDLLHPGDYVDVLATRTAGVSETGPSEYVPAEIVAAAARVLAIPRPDDNSAESVIGSGPSNDLESGTPVVLAVTPATSRLLASAAASSRLSVVVHPAPVRPSS